MGKVVARTSQAVIDLVVLSLAFWVAFMVRFDWDLPYERLDLPVLVMTGLQDRVFYERAGVEALTARLPMARALTLDNAGHLIPLERPAETVQALRDFAKGL